MTNKTTKRKMLNNNGVGLLLILNALLLVINIVILTTKNNEREVAFASEIEAIDAIDEKRKSDEVESEVESNEEITFTIEEVAHFSEGIEGMPMYFSHTDENGAYFTYVKTDEPKSFDGYWYVTNDTLEKGYYDINLLSHNDELRAIFINDSVNGGSDYMQLRPANDLDKGYAYNQ